jgi:hypothetical protein
MARQYKLNELRVQFAPTVRPSNNLRPEVQALISKKTYTESGSK